MNWSLCHRRIKLWIDVIRNQPPVYCQYYWWLVQNDASASGSTPDQNIICASNNRWIKQRCDHWLVRRLMQVSKHQCDQKPTSRELVSKPSESGCTPVEHLISAPSASDEFVTSLPLLWHYFWKTGGEWFEEFPSMLFQDDHKGRCQKPQSWKLSVNFFGGYPLFR